jgi:hypothetical protein
METARVTMSRADGDAPEAQLRIALSLAVSVAPGSGCPAAGLR